MAQEHHKVSGHNHSAMSSEKKFDIEKMRMICWHTTVLVETHSIFAVRDLLVLLTLYWSQTDFNFQLDKMMLEAVYNGGWMKESNPAFRLTN